MRRSKVVGKKMTADHSGISIEERRRLPSDLRIVLLAIRKERIYSFDAFGVLDGGHRQVDGRSVRRLLRELGHRGFLVRQKLNYGGVVRWRYSVPPGFMPFVAREFRRYGINVYQESTGGSEPASVQSE